MGMADFYLKININIHNHVEFESIYQSFVRENIFRILDRNTELHFLILECNFDNLIPSAIVAFDNLYPFKDSIMSIETHGITNDFTFNNVEDFLNFIFGNNKNKLLSYYRQMGYFAIDSHNYYKKRIKLRRYYRKLK